MRRGQALVAVVVLAGCAHGGASGREGGAQGRGREPASTAARLGPSEPQPAILAMATSTDGAHVALTARRPGGLQVSVDGAPDPVVTTILPITGGVALAEHAGVAAYWAAEEGRNAFLVLHGREVPLETGSDADDDAAADVQATPQQAPAPAPAQPAPEVRIIPVAAPAVSPDGRRVAAWARVEDRLRGTRTLLWVDGRVVGQFAGVRELVGFDPTGRHVAAVVDSSGGISVWVDGWERSGYTFVNPASVRWHDDGTVSFLARRGQRGILFHRDREIELAAMPVSISSPDENGRVAYVIVAAQQQQVILDDQIVASHDDVTDLDFVNGRLRIVARDGARTHLSILGVGDLSPASSIVSDSYAEREGCALYSAVLPTDGSPPPEPAAVPTTGATEAAPLGRYVVQESLPGRDACPTRRWGPFDDTGAPRWLASGIPAFISRQPDAMLHVGNQRLSLGALPNGLNSTGLREDGRIVHLAEVDGSLVRVSRAPHDLRPTSAILAPAPRIAERGMSGLSRVVLGELPPGVLGQASLDPDSGRIAALLTGGAVRRLVVGRANRALIGVAASLPEGPQVGTRDVAVQTSGMEDRVVPPHEILSPAPAWRDGHLVYAVWDASARKTYVRRDGQLAGTFEQQRAIEVGTGGAWWTAPWTDGHEWSVVWGADGHRIALGVATGGRLVTSPDGRRWAARTSDEPRQLVVDGEPMARGTAMTDPIWSPHGAHVVVATIPNGGAGRWSLLVDGRVRAEEPAAIVPLAVGDDGTPAYGVQRSGAITIVAAGQRSGPWTNVAWTSARADDTGRHVAVLALDRSGETAVVRDGEELRRDVAEPELCALASGSGALAWLGRVGDADVILVDRAVVGGAGVIPSESVRWSPDGATLAWLGASRGRDRRTTWTVHVGDATHGPYDEVLPAGVAFGPHGQAAWMARRGARWSLWVDGRAIAAFDDPADGPAWGRDGSVSALAFEGRQLVWLRFRPTAR